MRYQPLRKSVPEVCQSIAEQGVLAGLVRRKNSKLRAVNGGRRTDSVPGTTKINDLQLALSRRIGCGRWADRQSHRALRFSGETKSIT